MTTNKLPSTALSFPNSAGQHFNQWVATLPPGHAFGELFGAGYWSHVAPKLRPLDVVRVIAHDGSFDVTLTVRARPAGGAVMELWPKFPKGYGTQSDAEAAAAAETARPQVVPILPNGKDAVRVDFTEATKWRVIAISGEPLESGIATVEEANAIMKRYLGELRLRLATDDERAADAKLRAERDAARQASDAKRKSRRAA